MFTGIIEELGLVQSLAKRGAVAKLQILAPMIGSDIQAGQSVCVNGACLTVVEARRGLLCFEIMQETLKRTNLDFLKAGNNVNLERALRADGRIDGHFVSGHIDATGKVVSKQNKGGDTVIKIEASEQILRHIALKGSVSLDGVGLTVSALEKGTFSANLITYTLANTTLGFKKEGDTVNIECDLLAKYMDKLLSQNKQSSASNISASFLQQHGFI